MEKKLTISNTAFTHESHDISVELRQAADPSIIIFLIKKGKDQITTSFTKSDLTMLSEFLKLRNIE